MTAASPEQAARRISWMGASGCAASRRACGKAKRAPPVPPASLLLGNVLKPNSWAKIGVRQAVVHRCLLVAGQWYEAAPKVGAPPETVL
jgi:hypothetical protein